MRDGNSTTEAAKRPPLLVIGASARAAAGSAIRAGWSPAAIDLFGDEDLRAMAAVRVSRRYPHDLADLAAELPPMPWVFTGALENHPAVVDRIPERHRLLGNAGRVLRSVRDPWEVNRVLTEAELPALPWRSSDAPPRDGRWLRKPLAGSAGRGIAIWNETAPPTRAPHFFQRFVDGEPLSAVFLAGDSATELVIVTRQLIGDPCAEAGPFAYAGNVAPWPVTESVRTTIGAIGTALSEAFGLRGLFGCDFVLAESAPWLVEVNPRYTASVELAEFVTGRALLHEHARCCGSDPLPTAVPATVPRPVFVGKRILYAADDFTVPPTDAGVAGSGPGSPGGSPADSVWTVPRVADLPAAGSRILHGHPVCTVFSTGTDAAAVDRTLVTYPRATDWPVDTSP